MCVLFVFLVCVHACMYVCIIIITTIIVAVDVVVLLLIMVLSFLSAQNIQSMFIRIESLVPPNRKMCELITYICSPGIDHPMFVPHCWTVYNITVHLSRNRLGPFWNGSVFVTIRS